MGIPEQIEQMKKHILDGKINSAYELFCEGGNYIKPQLSVDDVRKVHDDLSHLYRSRKAMYGDDRHDREHVDLLVSDVELKVKMLNRMLPENALDLESVPAPSITQRIRRDSGEQSPRTIRVERKYGKKD